MSAGANSTNLLRDLPYTDRVSGQTLAGATAPLPPPAMYGPADGKHKKASSVGNCKLAIFALTGCSLLKQFSGKLIDESC